MSSPPIEDLRAKAAAHAARRLGGDRGKAPEELHPLFDRLAEHLRDPELSLDDLQVESLANRRLRQRFRRRFGMAVKRYLLRLKQDMAEWLLSRTELGIRDVAEVLGYSQPSNFSRDFGRWTGQSPTAFRDAASPSSPAGPAGRRRLPARVSRRLSGRLGIPLGPETGGLGEDPAAERLLIFHGGPQGEATARQAWELLRGETPERARELVLDEVLFATPELFELLSRRSREEGRRNRRRGVELAELALAVVEAGAPFLGELYGDLLVLAHARLGNALRLAGELERARDAFRRAEEVWALPEGRKDPRVEAELWFLKGSLRLFERRFNSALQLLDRSLAIAHQIGDRQLQLQALLQRIALKGYQDRLVEMLTDLDKAELLLAAGFPTDRAHLLGVYQDKAWACLETGRNAEARRNLARAQELCDEAGHPTIREQLRWIGALLALSTGDPERAERLLRQSRAGFLKLGDRVRAGLSALELAIIYHQQGRFPDVALLVLADVLPALEDVRLHREARVALELLRQAVAEARQR